MMERLVEVGLILGLLWIWSRYYQRACRAVSSSVERPEAAPVMQEKVREEADDERSASDNSAAGYSPPGPKVHEAAEA